MSHIRTEKYCGKCVHFSLQDLPAGTAPGRARCMMFEQTEPHLATPGWDTPGCVIYAPTKHMSKRQEWISKQQPTKGKNDGRPA